MGVRISWARKRKEGGQSLVRGEVVRFQCIFSVSPFAFFFSFPFPKKWRQLVTKILLFPRLQNTIPVGKKAGEGGEMYDYCCFE